MSHAFTPEQQAAIDQREGPLLLSANAGSGKTSVLVERLVAAVLEDGIAPAQLLAITFTDKAAGELRSRVRSRLAALGERAAARDVERAQISTIHGFCSGVLRAHAVAAGLDPGFEVLPTSAQRALRARAFETALADLLADVGGAPRTAALDLAAAWGPDRLQGAILEVHDALRSQGSTVPRLPAYAPRTTVDTALATLRTATTTFADELRDARTGPKSLEGARDVLSEAFVLLDAGDVAALGALKVGRSVPELQTPACDAWRAAVEALAAAVVDREAGADHALLDELLTGFAAHYAAGKRAASGLDYDDLELHTRDLLRDAPAVAASYAERFARIMVDEFQDTNRLQLELVSYLDRGNVFLVGDELQSIYGFRHADVELFREQRARHAAQGRAKVLATNWRSQPELLGTINGAWGAAVHPSYVPLVAGRDDEPAAAPRTELLLTSAEAWDADDLDPRLADELAQGMPAGVKASKLAEARAIAKRVRALVDARECSEADVVVLVRAATDLHVFERALEREGFATLAGGGRGYWLRQPVQDLTSYLGALVNPRDERALYGVLASPLCGLSSDGLAHVAAVARTGRGGAWLALRSVALGRAPRQRGRRGPRGVPGALRGGADRRTALRPRRAPRARGAPGGLRPPRAPAAGRAPPAGQRPQAPAPRGGVRGRARPRRPRLHRPRHRGGRGRRARGRGARGAQRGARDPPHDHPRREGPRVRGRRGRRPRAQEPRGVRRPARGGRPGGPAAPAPGTQGRRRARPRGARRPRPRRRRGGGPAHPARRVHPRGGAPHPQRRGACRRRVAQGRPDGLPALLGRPADRGAPARAAARGAVARRRPGRRLRPHPRRRPPRRPRDRPRDPGPGRAAAPGRPARHVRGPRAAERRFTAKAWR